ncbi:hypothetical protein [Halobacillus sp. BBL2006]|uniref:hypothetical protein n=1 Tax=Halobacillus sp. BBL2006 TaxID=1543706 RepID=UPI000541CD8B|nr:hypothetical protein [Halobacillus sp. BBL2006]KHE72505.1 hypothetical protein LD39_04205 [Halobacillus sp. BBL2006]
MKKIYLTFMVLLTISSILLLYQWTSLKEQEASRMNSGKQALIDIMLTIKNDTIYVNYSFSMIPQGSYSILLPDKADSFSCTYEDDKDCSVKTYRNRIQWIVSDPQSATVTYQLPLPSTKLIKGWLLGIERNGAAWGPAYQISIEDHQHLDQSWAGSTEKNFDVQKEWIHFQQFVSTTNRSFPLKLQESDRSVWSGGNGIITYSTNHTLKRETRKQLQNVLKAYGPLMIELDRSFFRLGEGYVAIEDRNIQDIERSLFRKHLTRLAEEGESWVVSVITDTVFPEFENKSMDDHSVQLIGELRNALTEKQRKQWKSLLLQKNGGQSLTQYADESLSSLKGGKTAFFKANGGGGKVPLYFERPQAVAFDNKKVPWTIIEMEGTLYLPLIELVKEAEYSITTLDSPQAFRVSTPQNIYRFYPGQSTFIVNEQEFGFGEGLLREIKGKFYINGSYIKDLLRIGLKEGESTIFIQKNRAALNRQPFFFESFNIIQKSKGRGETGGSAYGDVSLLRFQKQFVPLQL